MHVVLVRQLGIFRGNVTVREDISKERAEVVSYSKWNIMLNQEVGHFNFSTSDLQVYYLIRQPYNNYYCKTFLHDLRVDQRA